MRFHFSLHSWVYSLFLLLLLIGLGAVVGFNRFQQMVGRETKVEHADEVASQQLLLALIDQHQALHQLLADEAAPATPADWQRRADALRRAADAVERQLATAQEVFDRATGPEETRLAGQLRGSAVAYVRALRQAADSCAMREGEPATARLPAGLRDRELSLLNPPAQELRRELTRWIQAKGDDLAQTREKTTRHARNLSFWMVFVTVLGILVLLLFNYQIDEALVLPAKQMRKLIQGVNGGDLSLRLPELREDYLNGVAIACNALIESLNGMAEESRRRLVQEKELAVALGEAIAVPVLAINPVGELLLANEQGRDLFVGTDGARRLAQLREAIANRQPTVRLGERLYRLTGSGVDAATPGMVGVILLTPEPGGAPGASPRPGESPHS